jgi:hypothetical protein
MRPLVKVTSICIGITFYVYAHDLRQQSHGSHTAPIETKSTQMSAPKQAEPFNHFAPLVQTRFDDNFLYIESNSIPDHPMMIGITAWQQQVPLPQPYNGNNAWRIPLHPVVAKNPLSAKNNFFRGAIALAANGVPIFNPIKNDGKTDTLLAGELDNWGGHSGRGDDYHYHVAPLHLQEILGDAHPVAYALDGYPIYGYTEPDGSPAGKLDAFNGHTSPEGDYHYHATKTYPYLNGGFHGQIENRDGQVHPQPRAGGVRPYTRPLRGATITDWSHPDENTFSLKYKLGGKTSTVAYTLLDQGHVRFDFIDSKGNTTSETYSPEDRRGSQNGGGGEGEKRGGNHDENRRNNRDQKRSQGDRPNSRADASERPRKGPDPNDPNRKPWIEAHAAEIDADKDGTVSRPEIVAEIAKTLQTMDTNSDNSISQEESNARGNKLPMAGFVKGHFDELDKNDDTKISSQELSESFLRMYDRQGQKKRN